MDKLITSLDTNLGAVLREQLDTNFQKIQNGVDGQADSLNKQIETMLGDVPLQDKNEVTQARIDDNNVVYSTLKGRLDVDQTTAETALKEERLTGIEVQAARSNSSGKNYDTLKARLDDEEANLTNNMNAKIAQISSVPETFANLSALQATYPNGKTGLFVTADTGHKYIWANGTWADAGVYQAVGVADGSITTEAVSALVKNAIIYNHETSGDRTINIDTIKNTLTIKGFLNYGSNSVLLPDTVIDLTLHRNNILYYDTTSNSIGAKDALSYLNETDVYLGVVDSDLGVIDIKATHFSIDGFDIPQNLTNKYKARNMYVYGDAIINTDDQTVAFPNAYVNFDFGAGVATAATTIDVSTNKIVYLDLKDNTIKNTDNYNKITDTQLFLGNFDADNPEKTFHANFTRVLVIKNGITYPLDDFTAKMSTLSNVYMQTFGDSITSDQVSGTGTQIMNAIGAKNGGNFATGWSTASDWHNGDTNITTVTLTAPNNTDTNDNVLSNQVRRALQYTTAAGQPITWVHPVDGTFVLDTSIGTGLGNTDKKPSVIYIAISTNDGKNNNVPVVDDTDTVFSQTYSQLTKNSIASALRWAIETLQSAYPDAKIFIASPLQTDKTSGTMNFSYGNLKRDIIEKVARFTSVSYIDSFSESGFSILKNKSLTVDGVHPSDEGKKQLVDYVTNEIREKLR